MRLALSLNVILSLLIALLIAALIIGWPYSLLVLVLGIGVLAVGWRGMEADRYPAGEMVCDECGEKIDVVYYEKGRKNVCPACYLRDR